MSDDAFHPDLRRLARVLPRTSIGPRALGPTRALSSVVSRLRVNTVPVEPAGSVSVRVFGATSGGDLRPGLLWIHGGGYVLGTASIDDAICGYFAEALGIVVASVDYRLAPEHPFPVPLHDCYDGLAWLAAQPNVDPERIAVGGASAGGGLAAALVLLAHERGEIPLAFQLLTYPMLDDRTATRTDLDERNLRMWTNKSNRFGWESYTGLPVGSPEVTGLAAPARYTDLSGLPSTWIGVGTCDLFYEEDLAYAARLREAGVACEVEEVPGAFHGFDSVLPKAGVTRAFRASQAAALASALY